jgi:hypothetical protein
LFIWFIDVYYESRKRELKTRPIYECRCDERLKTIKTKAEKSTRLFYFRLAFGERNIFFDFFLKCLFVISFFLISRNSTLSMVAPDPEAVFQPTMRRRETQEMQV